MLTKPDSCRPCPLYGNGQGLVPDEGTGEVLLVCEAAGKAEAEGGRPLIGKAGHFFAKMLSRAGLSREHMGIGNVIHCRPPENKLRGMPYEHAAVARCAHFLDETIRRIRPRVVVAGGDVALSRLLGWSGITRHRGYVFEGGERRGEYWVLPTFHPAYIMRGQWKHEATFIYDMQHAFQIAGAGYAYRNPAYVLDPPPDAALGWARMVLAEVARTGGRVAIDIETPKKGEDEDELDPVDYTYLIFRIGFAYGGGLAMSIPWDGAYMPAIRLLCESPGEKVVWSGYDVPRIRAAGVGVKGVVHDAMLKWHVLHSDLPKSLGFVAPWLVPDQAMWKHTSTTQPAQYNATDVDVTWIGDARLDGLLREAGMWHVYEEQILDLEPILIHMHEKGMPVDQERRLQYAIELDHRLQAAKDALAEVVPDEALEAHPKEGYVRPPKDFPGEGAPGWRQVEVQVEIRRCAVCGLVAPRKDHFRRPKKRPNLCAGASVSPPAVEPVQRWARLLPFKVSGKRLLAYCQVKGYRPIVRKDPYTGERRVTFDEAAMRTLALRHEGDPLFMRVLAWRGLDKLASTYIGRVSLEPTLPIPPPPSPDFSRSVYVLPDDDIPF